VSLGAVLLALAGFSDSLAQSDDSLQQPAASPWGVSSSSGSFRTHADWVPKIAEAGVATVRLFPEWREIEPLKGVWKWERTDALVKTAAENKVEINAILMGSAPGEQKTHAFPTASLTDWSNYVATVVSRYKGRIRYWEVWNEGNGGFNDGHHTTADYAKLAVSTYEAAKHADPNAKVGLTVASFDAPYLSHAIQAMVQEGKPNSFDFLCIHPYEIADGLADADGEIPFLWMSRLLRDMLKSSAPERGAAEIWITEVSRRIEKRNGSAVTEADAAKGLVKLYAMAVAQGVRRTQWFEAQDPANEDQGFGLLNREGKPRASYLALKTLSARLGARPKVVGWLALGRDGKGYGFVFENGNVPVLVAWMPLGRSEPPLTFAGDVEVVDALSDVQTPLKAGQPLELTDRPVLVAGLPAGLVQVARSNASQAFPWGGSYSAVQTVNGQPGLPEGGQGIFQVRRDATPTVRFPDGSAGILVRGDQSVCFYVHPSFAGIQTKEYYIRVSVRRVAPGNVGMNLFYELADSQGRTPYRNREQWFSAAPDMGWQTNTWHVTDACFSKMWGYDFSLRPEQSVPFVIGKVEVSTVPFK